MIHQHPPRPEAAHRGVEVLIVGAGASGIGAAVTLRRLGIEDFVVLEKSDSVGGTWRDNTYPGCACDVPSALYSYSFAPNPAWSRAFAEQPEIRAYLEDVARRHGVLEHVHTGVEMTAARWDDAVDRWLVATSAGSWSARVLVEAAGPWHEPLLPEIDGLESFPGRVFHSSRWAHDEPLHGRRVAVVGTGASAVQIIPAIADEVGELHVYQRTAQWVLPKPDVRVPGPVRTLLRRVPGALRALRAVEYGVMETLGVGFRRPWLLRLVQRVGLLHLRRCVRDPALRSALTPDYTLGCKRLLMSNSYYPALTRPHVHVHATAVREVRGSVVVGDDGSSCEVDLIVFGTGFHILDMPVADRIRDAAGRSLADHWKGSPEGYLGTTVSGFPNLFLLLGPNLGTGHSSAFSILEAQLNHLAGVLDGMRRHGWTALDARPDVQQAWNEDVQRALARTVYNAGGCSSYYLDDNGRNSFSWPWSTARLRRRVGRFDPRDYLTRRVDTPAPGSTATGSTRDACSSEVAN